jgi:hypothetical protein
MQNGGQGNPPPFDWEGFQQRFFEEGGWRQNIGEMSGKMPWLDDYVNQILKKVVPDADAKVSATSPRHSTSTSNLFETHDLYIVRIKLPSDTALQDLELWVSASELQLRGIEYDDITVRFPGPVRIEGCRAIYKRHIIEVRIQKEHAPVYRKIDIKRVRSR